MEKVYAKVTHTRTLKVNPSAYDRKFSQLSPHLKRKRRLLVVNADKDLADYQFLAVVIKHKVCAVAFVIFSLYRDQREDA